MLQFYFYTGPNPTKVALLLEELEIPFEPVAVDMFKGEQHKPEYLAINPNGKIPAIVDDGVVVFDSQAILLHLATKHGRFIPSEPKQHAQMLSWLLFVASGLSPFSGQAVHFLHHAPHFLHHAPEALPYATRRYVNEVERHYRVLDAHLAGSKYLAGDTYSIADMAFWGWANSAGYIFGEKGLADYPHVKRLADEISARPAAIRALSLKDRFEFKAEFDQATLRALFPMNMSPA
jgi:GSH-dependent disulfide-bond oxidoreductase